MWERKRSNSKWPYGYMKDPEDEAYVIPDPDILPFILEALEHLRRGQSTRDVARWLTEKTGSPISHVALNNIFLKANPDILEERMKARRKRAPKTPEQKLMRRKRQQISNEKRKITNAKKNLDKLNNVVQEIQEVIEFKEAQVVKEYTPEQVHLVDEIEDEGNIVFRPNPGPQEEFLAADEQEVLYGGSAGSGKSYALIADPMRYFDNPNFVGIILRRTNDELRELIMKAQMLYKKAFGNSIRWEVQKSQFKLPGGGVLWFTYLEREQDVLRYQGQSFTYIAFDELTQHITPFAWNYMRSRLRDASGTLPLYMRATTNPGGPGHGWVKKMFIDPAPYGEAFWATDLETGELLQFPKGHAKEGQPLFRRRFIPARLSDNPYLFEDGQYETNLLSLPEAQQKQLLYGDWSVADGAAFPEFSQRHHVCKPFEIPDNWRKFRSCDFGYASASAVHWYAVDPDGRLYVYRELYTSKKTARELALEILSKERDEKIIYGVLDSSTWAKRGDQGPSIAEEMISVGCRWRPSDRTAGSRAAGKNRLHQLLRVPDTGQPMIMFFDNCRRIISDLEVIPVDPDGADDINVNYRDDHSYDSIRYGIMTRPAPNGVFEMWAKDRPINNYRPFDKGFGY